MSTVSKNFVRSLKNNWNSEMDKEVFMAFAPEGNGAVNSFIRGDKFPAFDEKLT